MSITKNYVFKEVVSYANGCVKGDHQVNKIYPSAAAALQGIVKDGQLMAVGGFGLCGIPEALIDALCASGVKDLTVISNNAGVDASAWANCWRRVRSPR